MSWGYWGIVTGLLTLVTLFFFSLDLFYGGVEAPPDIEKQTPPTGAEADATSRSRHAA